MLVVQQIPVMVDNYVYLIHDPASGQTAVVDPAEPGPVLRMLAERHWKLSLILNTHHHWDHIGGNLALKEQTGCAVIGAESDRERIPGIDRGVREGDLVQLGRSAAQVVAVPGHTLGHIAYYFADQVMLFCGDTLFGMGCGRLFEGSAQQMWSSLSKLRALPSATQVYCAHEYTEANGHFALTIEPDNPDLIARMREIESWRRLERPTVPFSIAEELATNPFLRPESPAIRTRLNMNDAANAEVFAEVRRRKDQFRG